jgi:glycosyltransferase involved in cell wall biosynthesis
LKILFLHEVNYLTKPIFEMHEFPEHLARLGHEIGFVQFPESLSQTQIKELGKRRKISGRVIDDAEIELFTPWTINGSFVGRLFTALFFYWQFKKILGEFQADVVVSFSVPTSGWQALIACRQAKVPYVFRALDVSHKIRRGVFSNLVKLAEKFTYQNADALSANNPAMLEYCAAMSGRRKALAAVHSPPLDLEAFSCGDRSTGRRVLGINSEEEVILYMGSFFYFSGLPDVLRVLSESSVAVKLVLVGGGEQEAELQAVTRELGLVARVIFTGMIPYPELPDLLAAADVAINPMEKTLVSDSALPNKVLQYMACGVPVASTSLKGLVSTFGEDSGITWGSSPREVMTLAINLLESQELKALSKLESSAIENFKAQSNPKVFADFLQKVVSAR